MRNELRIYQFFAIVSLPAKSTFRRPVLVLLLFLDLTFDTFDRPFFFCSSLPMIETLKDQVVQTSLRDTHGIHQASRLRTDWGMRG